MLSVARIASGTCTPFSPVQPFQKHLRKRNQGEGVLTQQSNIHRDTLLPSGTYNGPPLVALGAWRLSHPPLRAVSGLGHR